MRRLLGLFSFSWSAIRSEKSVPGLFAVELRILRRDDLPSTIPLEPSIGPNQASGFVGSVFSLPD
jgi:hypothetical protein